MDEMEKLLEESLAFELGGGGSTNLRATVLGNK